MWDVYCFSRSYGLGALDLMDGNKIDQFDLCRRILRLSTHQLTYVRYVYKDSWLLLVLFVGFFFILLVFFDAVVVVIIVIINYIVSELSFHGH